MIESDRRAAAIAQENEAIPQVSAGKFLGAAQWSCFAALALLLGCEGTTGGASRNRTFYDWTVAAGASARSAFEIRDPALDQAVAATPTQYIGVRVLKGRVRFARPRNWLLREGGNQARQSYVQYISPNAYSFAVYERLDSPADDWKEIQQHLRDDVQAVGAKLIGGPVPVSAFRGEGRAFSVSRQVDATRVPLTSHSREYLFRGDSRVVLVQIVHDADNLSAVAAELAEVLRTLEVL